MKSKTIYYKSEKGCPFCQQKDGIIVKSTPAAVKGLQVECTDCGARGPIYATKEGAISGWELGTFGIDGRKRKL